MAEGSTPDTEGLPRQFAALPWRIRKGRAKILLVTSRETRRLIVPKGWPIEGLKPHRVAEREAREEAGVVGKASRHAIGSFAYWKRMRRSFVLCGVDVFPLEVREQLDDWPERDERQRVWVTADEAALIVDEPGLAALLKAFDPAMAA
jgi:8-oxo-dGTP pyrophosphatase MutT (NUDIX family)